MVRKTGQMVDFNCFVPTTTVVVRVGVLVGPRHVFFTMGSTYAKEEKMSSNRALVLAAIFGMLLLLGIEVHAQTDIELDGSTARLQYQGRLTDPSTGELAADNNYTLIFRIYNRRSGGTPVWTETQIASVRSGLFSVLLGDVTPLNHTIFSGQALWLGIQVEEDEEASPRQQILPVAYALSLMPGAEVRSAGDGSALQVSNIGSGLALHAVGPVKVDGNLSVAGSFDGGTHSHDASEIGSGRIEDSRIDTTIARDIEVGVRIDSHASDASAHHLRYTDTEAASAAFSHPEIVTQYELDDHVYGGMHTGRYIAAGIIRQDGSIASATGNVSSHWNALCQCYEITIDGHTYDHWSYITVVNPILGGITSAWSVEGKLLVGIYDLDSNPSRQPFQFLTFMP